MSIALFLILGLGSISTSQAAEVQAKRDWKSIPIEGAVCGDGSPYNVFVSAGDPHKIAFDLMGGGVCWSAANCYGPVPTTLVHALPTVMESGGFVSTSMERSPVSDYTLVFFPYCTGDVHMGDHQAHYLPGLTFHHEGKRNIRLAVKQIADRSVVDLAHAQHFVLMGYSAGSLGALFHATWIANYVKSVKDKSLIIDAPGLHFGDRFWDKFTPEMVHDFDDALSVVRMRATPGRGNLAALVPGVCHLLADWRVGVLQGTRDFIMSTFFGNISPEEHEALIFGPTGLYALTQDPTDNCAAWFATTQQHTFLPTDQTASIRSDSGKSAMDFVTDVIHGAVAGPNYR